MTDEIALEPLPGGDGDSTATAFARHGYAFVSALIEAPVADFLWSYVHTRFASGLLEFRRTAGARTASAATADPRSRACSNSSGRGSSN